ncbi:MAG TPA: TOBE domain-containing protein [Solirubrobacteraceae bacterium]|jgi:molybdopterin-binding protein|nr:TOBE domain-containing protein [Solirubrobacteraceae bacterium]
MSHETPPDTPAIEELVKIGSAASALGVSVDTLRRWERAGKIRFQRRDNQRYLSAADLSKLLSDRSAKGLTSARNRMQGIVIAVKRDDVMAQIDMICGPYRIVSLMSREAADELDLKPGAQATAVVKATTVIVETR